MGRFKNNYYWFYTKTLWLKLKDIPHIIRSFFGDVRRANDDRLNWAARYQSEQTKKPVKVTQSRGKLTVFPCGCNALMNLRGELYLDNFRCYNTNHRKKMGNGFVTNSKAFFDIHGVQWGDLE